MRLKPSIVERVLHLSTGQIIIDLVKEKALQDPLWVNRECPEALIYLLRDEDVAKKVSEDVVYACRLLFGFNPYFYQENVLRDTSKYQIICIARQMGKTFTLAAKVLWLLLTRPKYSVLVIAPSIRQARFFRDRIDEHLVNMPRELRRKLFKKVMRERIITRIGSDLLLVPNSPDLYEALPATILSWTKQLC